MVLNAAPRWEDDVAVQYSFRWNRALIEDLGISAVELLEDEATKENYEKHAHEADLFIFYDHGGEDGLVEQGGKGYMVDIWNVGLLKGADVYTMCCSAAADLGKVAFRKGVKSWWGYDRPFSFVLDMDDTFCRLANLGLKIKRGSDCSWLEAADQVRLAYDEEIDRLRGDKKKVEVWSMSLIYWLG